MSFSFYITKHATITNTSGMYLGPSCVGECLPERGGRGWLLLPGAPLKRPETTELCGVVEHFMCFHYS